MSKGDKQTKKKRRPRFTGIKRLWRLFTLAVFALFVWLIYCYAVIILHPFDEPVEQADVAVVLGAALWNDRPSPALRERLDHALSLYDQQLVGKIIVSGGKGFAGQTYSEAEGMARYLVEQGVDESHIMLEQHSTNTYENIRFTKSILEREQIKDIIIVSHSYHAYRTSRIAQYLELGNVQVSGIESQVLNKPYHYTREVLAYSKWVLNSVSLKLGLYIN